MLQIVTEKFYQPGERYETLHRAVFYTNYCTMRRSDRFETPIGILLPATGHEGLASFTCEMLEKIEKYPDGAKAGVLVSTGGASLLNDFAAVTAFALNITCTPDPDLTRRLLTTERPSLGIDTVPSKFIRRTFDRQIISKDEDSLILSHFVAQLIGLERKRYEAAMRAIRQFITGLHRVSDNLSLAYTLLVMSIESISQDTDGQVAKWSDYESRKRKRIDTALEDAPVEISEKVRKAILENEHIAVARRFRDFTLSHVAPSFFREEAVKVVGPVSRGDLSITLKHAYDIRSRYIHQLQEIPSALTLPDSLEVVEGGNMPALSISALARLARHVIMQYVARGPVVEREDFDYRQAMPNLVTLPLAPQYWIAKTGGFTHEHGPLKLSAFIEQITAAVLLRKKEAHLTDIRPVLFLVEKIVPNLQDVHQRLPLLTLYFLFHQWAGPEFHCEQWPTLFKKYNADFEMPSIESFVAHILTDQKPDWTLEQYDDLHRTYFESRRGAGNTNIGRLLEAAFLLYVAEQHRSAGDDGRARELIGLAVEAHPSHTALCSFESTLTPRSLPEVQWKQILLPPGPTQSVTETNQADASSQSASASS